MNIETCPGSTAQKREYDEVKKGEVVSSLVVSSATATLVTRAAVRERGHLAMRVGDHSSPTSARMPMMKAPIPMASIRKLGYRSRGVQSTKSLALSLYCAALRAYSHLFPPAVLAQTMPLVPAQCRPVAG